MKKLTSQRHIIDILFVLSLFCVFAVSSVLLILFGADIYQKTVEQMDTNYTSRTSVAYLTEKIRQSDTADSICISSQNETEILMLTYKINGITYATSLCEYNGYLYELFARADLELPLDAGQPVMELHSLSFSMVTPSIIEIRFTDTTNEEQTIFVSMHSRMEADNE